MPSCIETSLVCLLALAQKDPTHTANFGVKLQERLRSLGVDCELVYPGAPDVKHANVGPGVRGVVPVLQGL